MTLVQGSTGSSVTASGVGTDTYKNIEGVIGGSAGDTLTGSGGNDILVGSGGNDTLYGESGNDVLAGGTGIDTLRGDGGSDTFKFGYNQGTDEIVDFTLGNPSDTADADILQISDVLIGAHSADPSVPLDLAGAIAGGYLYAVEHFGGGTDIVLDTNAGGGGGQSIIVTLNTAFSSDILSTLLGGDGVGGGNDQLK